MMLLSAQIWECERMSVDTTGMRSMKGVLGVGRRGKIYMGIPRSFKSFLYHRYLSFSSYTPVLSSHERGHLKPDSCFTQ
ncbi:hypothetical protein SUGI_0143040 [Cryptomeria japonica]|nr:hypothetical protein SUGI_0143040 [Cryptomeria japonica]